MAKSNLRTHLQENNSDSQSYLEENEQRLNECCLKVMEVLNRGIKLTVINAHSHGISSLPRRVKDLRDKNGVTNIIDEWVTDTKGKRLFKIWYINITTRPTKKEVVEKAKHSQLGSLPQSNLF